MEKLIEKMENIFKELDETSCIKKIKELNPKVLEDKDLLDKINLYRITQDEKVKEQIINNSLFQEYNHYEYEVNMLILEINQKLKKVFKSGGCNL